VLRIPIKPAGDSGRNLPPVRQQKQLTGVAGLDWNIQESRMEHGSGFLFSMEGVSKFSIE